MLLSDTKIDEKTFGDHFALTDLARKDKFTGVQATITPAEDGYFDAIGMHEWKKKSQTTGEISGKLSTDHEHKFFKTTYSYSADFTAPIAPEPKKK